MKLSIITPYFQTLKEIQKLRGILEPQLNQNVEWIIIDDGCNEHELDTFKATVIHLDKNSGGASVPRNKGLDIAKGEYIAFIDSDDLITSNYVQKILDKTKEEWDYCYISFEMNGKALIIKDEPPEWNCCIWNCVYKRELIGEERFDPNLILAEDYDFNKRVRKGKKANITNMLYFYQYREGSLTKRGK